MSKTPIPVYRDRPREYISICIAKDQAINPRDPEDIMPTGEPVIYGSRPNDPELIRECQNYEKLGLLAEDEQGFYVPVGFSAIRERARKLIKNFKASGVERSRKK